MDGFVSAVASAFGLGSPDEIKVDQMKGSANRLWRFDGPLGVFVVKELSHDTVEDLGRRRRAASFELAVMATGEVVMPEPVVAKDGQLVLWLPGSRGEHCGVRVHRWLDGAHILDATAATARQAGSCLGRIQRVGSGWSSQPMGSLRWWDQEPLQVIARLDVSDLLPTNKTRALSIAESTLDLLGEAERISGVWGYSHCDHKPENALSVGGIPAVLDWDECGHIHSRLESVESALRWSGHRRPGQTLTWPRQHLFVAFLDGYRETGTTIDNLEPPDFAKWLAALLGWFAFQGRRSLGDWPSDSPPERERAAEMAAETLEVLSRSLVLLPTWCGWV